MWRYALLLLTSLILARCSHKEDFQIGKEWLLDSGYGLQPEARQQLRNALLKNGDENLSLLIKSRLQLKNYASQEDKYQVPKRTISLLTRWKTLEQIRRNYLNQSFQRQQKKQASPGEEPWSPITAEGLITAVGRGYQRSLRPPGQPLRWG